MSEIKIVKNLPFSFTIAVLNDNVPVNLNDSTWNTSVELRYQTTDGTIPFTITPSTSGNILLVDLTSDQTNLLDHRGTGYVLIVRASKIDNTINLRNVIPVSVVNDI